mmetsp:Transcript_4521/g.17106  ORF Transcript_4521/g.17106 Transcript_4521/m.17106 type:complete len:896 (-) Transcript_4521:142-2829(-)|eukprot:CAMPEP_0117452724 /NCGR_PEP_ID=MMETSP0759-20121206/9789_1 /TAXON_ID=63605 /ORGANISM="Percolomonas cosmopolitus, Strain WS" /LENGTH=895 /DNA_ID=CAMNT_0005245601 /DNA_START=430 /DNA_END=3117 /DNA_ORIENTATION=-
MKRKYLKKDTKEGEESSTNATEKSKPASSTTTPSTEANHQSATFTSHPSIVAFRKRLSSLHKLACLPSKILHPLSIAPSSRLAFLLDILSCLYFLYNITTVPYRAAFETDSNTPFLVFDIVFDVIYWCYILSNFFRSHPSPDAGEESLITSRSYAFMHYVKWQFWVDFMIVLPFDWFLEDPKWRMTRLLGLIRFEMLYSNLEKHFRHRFPVALRFMKLFAYLLIAIHFGACFWYLSANLVGGGRRPSTHIIGEDRFSTVSVREMLMSREENPSYTYGNFRNYIVSLYFSSYYMMGYQSMLPQDIIQAIYAIFMAIVGAGFFATIISTASALVNDVNRTQQQFNARMTEIRDYMRFKKITPKLRKDIELYYTYLFRSKRLMERKDILGDIDTSLDRQIARCLHKDLVEKVPLFKAVENSLFIDDICTLLNYTLLLKGYYIIRKGEIGREMFFIKSGSVEVVNEEGNVVYATLSEGSFFGAVALTSEDSVRTASIRAAENCELYYLTKSSFEEILSIYPDALKIIKEITQKRVQETESKDKELEEEKKRAEQEHAYQLELKKQRIAREMELESDSSDDGENEEDREEYDALSTTSSDVSSSTDEDDEDGPMGASDGVPQEGGCISQDRLSKRVSKHEEIANALSRPDLASYSPSQRTSNMTFTPHNMSLVNTMVISSGARSHIASNPPGQQAHSRQIEVPSSVTSRSREPSSRAESLFNRHLSPQSALSGTVLTPPSPMSLPPRRRLTPNARTAAAHANGTPSRSSRIQFSSPQQFLSPQDHHHNSSSLGTPLPSDDNSITDHSTHHVVTRPSPAGNHFNLIPLSPLTPLVSRPVLGFNQQSRSPIIPPRTRRRIPDLYRTTRERGVNGDTPTRSEEDSPSRDASHGQNHSSNGNSS